MKNITTKLLLFFACLFFSVSIFSQDRVYMHSGEILAVSVDTIIGKELIYYMDNNGQQVRYVVSTDEIVRVLKADGSTIKFPPPYLDPTLYDGQLKRGLKFHLFSPLLGHTAFSYEQIVRPGRSIEYTVGFIGLGNNVELGSIPNEIGLPKRVFQDPFGFHIGVGYKLFSKPEVRFTGWRYRHLLQGWYVMPKIIAGTYKENTLIRTAPFGEDEKIRHSVRFANAMFYAGKQEVFGSSFVLEWQVGMGFGFDNEEDGDDLENHYVVTKASKYIAFGGGLRVGFLF